MTTLNKPIIYFTLALIIAYAVSKRTEPFESETRQVEEEFKDMTPRKLLILYRGKAEELLSGLETIGISTEDSMDPKRYPEIATLLKRKGLLPLL